MSQKQEILFEAKHMHKAFGPTIALKDVDFTVRRGEIRGLIGRKRFGKIHHHVHCFGDAAGHRRRDVL